MNLMFEQVNAMGEVLVRFAVPMLVQSSVLMIMLLLADFVLRKKVRAVFRYWLWMLVLVKLVLPSSMSSPVSVGRVIGDKLRYVSAEQLRTAKNSTLKAEPLENAALVRPSPVERFGEVTVAAPPLENVARGTAEHLQPPTTAIEVAAETAALSWQGLVFLAWLVVVVAMGLLLLQRALFVRQLVAQARQAKGLLVDSLEFCRRQMGVKTKVELKVSSNATSPAVCGLFRPVILLPANLAPSLGSRHLRAVLMHELAHIKRGDLWVNLLQTLLQIVYFYNPLLWVANVLIRRVREQAVDETVLVIMGEKARWYPETLVSVAKLAFERPVLSLRLIGVVESKSALKGRIKRILNRPIPKSAKLGIVGLVAILAIAVILLPMAMGDRETEASQDAEVVENVITPEHGAANMALNLRTGEFIKRSQAAKDAPLLSWSRLASPAHKDDVGLLAWNMKLDNVRRGKKNKPQIDLWTVNDVGSLPDYVFRGSIWDTEFIGPTSVKWPYLAAFKGADGTIGVLKVNKVEDSMVFVSYKLLSVPMANGKDIEKLPKVSIIEKRQIAKLSEKLMSEDDSIWKPAAEELKEIGPKIAEQMVELFDAGPCDVHAIEVLNTMATDEHVQGVMLRCLEVDPEIHPNTRHCALIVLAESGNRDHVSTIIPLFEKDVEDNKNYSMAAIALAELGGDEAFNVLVETVAKDIPLQLRWFIAGNLKRMGRPEAIPYLKEALTKVDASQTAPIARIIEAIRALENTKENHPRGFPLGLYSTTMRVIEPGDAGRYLHAYDLFGSGDTLFVKSPEKKLKPEDLKLEYYKALLEHDRGNLALELGPTNRLLVYRGIKIAPLRIETKPPHHYWTDVVDEMHQSQIRQVVLDYNKDNAKTIAGPIDGFQTHLFEVGDLFAVLLPTGQGAVLQIKEITASPRGIRLAVCYLDPLLALVGTDGATDSEGNATIGGKTQFAATLPNGVTVELVGICEHPSQGKQWWRPDGSILRAKPYENSPWTLDGSLYAYEFVYRVTGGEGVLTKFAYGRPFSGGMGPRCLSEQANQKINYRDPESLYNYIATSNEDSKDTDLTILIGNESQWQTVTAMESPHEVGMIGGINNVIITAPVEKDGKTYVDVVASRTEKQSRVVAIDEDGKQHIGPGWESTARLDGTKVISIRAEFPMPLKRIKSIEYQTQRFIPVIFKNVSLQPGVKSDVKVEIEYRQAKAKVTRTKYNLKLLHTKVIEFKLDNGRYPTEEVGLYALTEQPSDVLNYPRGGYVKGADVLKDAWGNEFYYERYPEGGGDFRIVSWGADGEEGGEGYNQDLYSTEVLKENSDTDLSETQSPLHLAVLGGHQETAAMLLSQGFDINAEDSEGNTPLHIAAANGHLGLVGFLIERGANVNAVNNKGQTPLHLAAQNGHQATAQLLIKRGAVKQVQAGGGDQGKEREVFLLDVDETHMMLDMATAETIEAPEADSPDAIWQAIERLGKGDLVYDQRALIFVRGATADVPLSTVTGNFIRYEIGQALPEEITVTTKEGRHYRVVIEQADDKGCKLRLRYAGTGQEHQKRQVREGLQGLIDAAEAGSVVTLPAGVYTEPITIDKPLILKGESAKDCVFQVTSNEPAIFVKAGQKGKVVIEDITVKWQLATSERSETPFAVAVRDCEVQVRNCRFYPLGNFKRCPVAIKSLGFSKLRIESCLFEGFEYTVCFGEGSEGSIADSIVAGSGHQGISLYSGSTASIVRNVVCNSRYHGVRSTGGTLDMRDNLVMNNANRGVYLGNKSAHGVVENNVIMGSGLVGVSGFAQTDVKVQNNLIMDCGEVGVGLQPSCRLVLEKNVIMNNPKGVVVFIKDSTSSYGAVVKENVYWNNELDTENCRKGAGSLDLDPGLLLPEAGDFDITNEQVLQKGYGLTNPAVFQSLWQKSKVFLEQRQMSPKSGKSTKADVPREDQRQSLGSKLEFRVVPKVGADRQPSLTETEFSQCCEVLQSAGPGAGDENYRWFEIKDDVKGDLPVRDYKGRRYVLLCSQPKYVMLPDQGWGLAKVDKGTDNLGRPMVKLLFDEKGAALFYKLTSSNISKPLAIAIDGKVVSAPTVMTAIRRAAVIAGTFSDEEVEQMVETLRKGMPPVDVEPESIAKAPNEVRQVYGVLEAWFEGCLAGGLDVIKRAYSSDYQSAERDLRQMRELLQMNADWRFSLVSVMWDEQEALAVSSALKLGDPKVEGPQVLVWTLTKADGRWGITDIDLEEVEGLQRENSRFFQKHPNAQVWFEEPGPHTLSEGKVEQNEKPGSY